jgi:hypothetical protein
MHPLSLQMLSHTLPRPAAALVALCPRTRPGLDRVHAEGVRDELYQGGVV